MKKVKIIFRYNTGQKIVIKKHDEELPTKPALMEMIQAVPGSIIFPNQIVWTAGLIHVRFKRCLI